MGRPERDGRNGAAGMGRPEWDGRNGTAGGGVPGGASFFVFVIIMLFYVVGGIKKISTN